MNALALGLIAAVAWGIHDILVRYVSRTIGIVQSMFFVLVFGGFVWLIIALIFGGFGKLDTDGTTLSITAGVCFSIALIGHYNAFAKGPVRIVAPIIGTFAVLAFGIAAILGKDITIAQWLAVLTLVAGIALVARQQGDQALDYSFIKLMGWCLVAIFGFAFTFALGQEVSSNGDPIMGGFVTRLTAILIVAVIYFYTRMKAPYKKLKFSWRQWAILFLIGTLDAIALGVVLAAGIYPNAEYASAASAIFGLITVLIAWIFLKEKINFVQWSGIFLTFTSIAFLASQ